MYILELSKQILREMSQKKLRSVLALFGIVWGTLAVILLLALGAGFYNASKANMHGFINGTLIFNHGVSSIPFRGIPPGNQIHIKASDVIKLAQLFPGIAGVSPIIQNKGTVVYQNQQVSTTIQGVAANYAMISNYQTVPGGRFIDIYDVNNNRPVIYIGSDLQQTLFGNKSALGQQVTISGLPFTVIGVLQQMPDTGDWYNNIALIPYTTATELWGDTDINSFIVLPADMNNSQTLQTSIISYFSDLLGFDPSDQSAMSVFDLTQIYQFFNWFFLSIEIFLGFCGAMTLGVGGLSVANIMFLIVTERTHEIGLRMAIGARQSHIMWQIILEAAVIVLTGGIIGFILALLTVFILTHLKLPSWLGTPIISAAVVIITFFILTLTALLAGYFPARKAAKMQPVKALAF